ncbi:diphosphomevalonate decarboxylase [Lactobacillus sp. PV012]|uniref:diphosphomevalonate decarboxylase n=1 Tax=Lactobacillus sp. PV012 TaxID=2594494 RepID=UPI00223FA572|nr:diphosphomevalonate decarboxylase [Lactobacillus sp. PV012]QNQ82309.1 diphosphomevalonate decarboxylase [Lactobacillus sp. PV012]
MNKKTARAHTNIALIKYWGKANPDLKLPLMSSLSMTLDAFYTDTTFEHSPELTENSFYLNGQKQDLSSSKRVFEYIKRLQKMYGFNDHFKISSINHVPTAAGLASSASAFAALAASFASSYQLDLDKKDLSKLARLGSGSATRSVYGGFVIWEKGNSHDTSFATSLIEKPAWDLQMLAVEVNTHPKEISSSTGMKLAQSSPFYQNWLARNQEEIDLMKKAIDNKDFTQLGELSELSANEMHSLNLTSQPSFTYFSPQTIALINLVHKLRQQGIECYYTIDAGPNVKILTKHNYTEKIVNSVQELFPNVKIVTAGFGPGVTILN